MKTNTGKNAFSLAYENGSWSNPIIMGKDICRGNARFPGISPDGKYFFFCSLRTGWLDIYWVSSKVIGKLRPKRNKNREDF